MKFATVGDVCVDDYENLGESYVGGNPINVAVYLKRFTEDVSFTGVVGTDKYGQIVKNRLTEKGVDISHLKTAEGSTAVTKVELVNNDRVFGDYIEGVMEDFKVDDADIDFFCEHDIVITGIWGNIHDECKKIKAKGTPIAFDFSDQPEHEIVGKAIGDVDYAFFSDDAGDTPKLREFMKEMQAKGPKQVIVTMGHHGSIVYDGKDFYTFGIIDCNVVDTMGAGDSFIAGYVFSQMNGASIPMSMRFGALDSCVTIGYKSAW